MFQLFLRMVRELFLPKVLESFWSKAVELTADDAHSSMKNMCDFESSLKTLQTNLKLLSAKASDVEEEIKNAELSGRKKRKREVEEWLEQVKSFEREVVELEAQVESQGLIMRLMDGGKAAELNEQAEKLVEKSRDIGELVLDICGSSGETFLTNGMVGEAFKENVEIVMGLLESREVSSIGIYGMGGVGKTTLAKHINNRLLQQSVGRVFWITVSQEFTITGLQEKIARLLGVDLSDEDEVDKRAMRLHTALSMMKDPVLILDDVWGNINLLEVGCSFGTGSCRLIVTTRSIEVCRRITCKKVIRVEKLGEEEAWKLFNETLGSETELGPQVEGIAKSMAKLCDGLPLGIITMAGSMRGEEATHRWRNALAELKECVAGGQDETGEVDEVFRVLKYSFDRLKRNHGSESNGFNTIQKCFMHFSLYPEDYEISRDDLVRGLISGGLLDEGRGWRGQVEQGHSILDKLVNVCLLESCIRYDGKESVKMHDLVRGMALKIGDGMYKRVSIGTGSMEEIYSPDEEEWTEGLEKVSLLTSGKWRFEEGFSPNCPSLSTLLLREDTNLDFIPDSFFSKMQGLCTLDLSYTNILVLPNTVSNVKSLKALLLEGCGKLESVPYLGKLKALRELNLSGTAIKEVPQGVEELLDLRFLSIDAPDLEMLQSGLLLKLVHLQHVNLPFHVHVEIKEIENLKELEEFGGRVENVSDFNWFIRSYRVHDPGYAMHVGPPFKRGSGYERYLRGKHNRLLLSRKNLKDEKVLGKGIVCLIIIECKGLRKWLVDDLWEQFDNPTSLKKLKIEHCGGIEWIMRREDVQLSSTLEHIHLHGLDDLKGVMERERGGIGIGIVAAAAAQPPVFSSLKRLLIIVCNKMRKLGLPRSALPNLEQIEIKWCREVEEIFEEEDEGRDFATTLPKLRKLYLSGLPRLRKVGLPASGVPNLESIGIESCAEVQEIFEDGGRDSATTLPKLRKLYLSGLPRLRKVGLPASGVPNLDEIIIQSCGEIQEIFEDEDDDDDEGEGIAAASILPKLWKLWLYKLPRLKRVSKATIISNSIQHIWIRKCPELMKKLPLNFDDPTPPPSLRDISVDREWWESLEWDINNPNLPHLLQPFLHFMPTHSLCMNLAWLILDDCM